MRRSAPGSSADRVGALVKGPAGPTIRASPIVACVRTGRPVLLPKARSGERRGATLHVAVLRNKPQPSLGHAGAAALWATRARFHQARTEIRIHVRNEIPGPAIRHAKRPASGGYGTGCADLFQKRNFARSYPRPWPEIDSEADSRQLGGGPARRTAGRLFRWLPRSGHVRGAVPGPANAAGRPGCG